MGSTKKSERKRHKRKDEDEVDSRKRREDDDDEGRESKKRQEKEHKSKKKERKEKKHSKRDYSSDDEPEKKRSKREEASSESEGEEGRSERKRKHRHKRRGSGSLSPHRQRERDGSLTREEGREADLDKKDTKTKDTPVDSPPLPPTSGSVVEMSVEETNKVRAQLGLRPLDVGGGSKKEGEGDGEGEEGTGKQEDVHAPAKNLGAEKSAQKMKERMHTLKEKKQISKKLRSVKALGEADSDGEGSALSWVDKMRQKDEEKRMAQERARLLEEMDEEFGVDSLLKETVKDEKLKAYTAQDLRGLSVQHKEDTFQEGRTLILTLKDSGVLDDGEDTLENVNIVEEEKAVRNVTLKKKHPGYDAYEDEFDEFGNLKEKKVLSKYDEEIDGIKQESFQLGDAGVFDASEERERKLVQQRLHSGAVSLQVAPSQVAREYYTEEEMVKFKKPKKKRKVKKTLLRADDLLPTGDTVGEDVEQGSRDHGRRSRHRHSDEEEDELGMDVDVKPVIVDDTEVDNAIEVALERTRKLLNAKREGPEGGGAAKVAQILQQVPRIKQETPVSDDAIVLDRTAEFCLQLGEEAGGQRSAKDAVRRATLTEEDMDVDANQEVGGAEDKLQSGWMEVSMDAKPQPTEKDLYQEAEPVVAMGMAAALQVASRRGFIETKNVSEEKTIKKGPSSVGVKEEQGRGGDQRDADRIRDRDRDRDRERDRDRDPHSFPEKKDYRPDVNIVYTDDFGRELESKEAFRFMSHKFHGKGSGKKKTERRMKRVLDEFDLQKADSQDTPLGTLGLMQDKQKQTSLPYIMLSGQQTAPPGASTLSKTKH